MLRNHDPLNIKLSKDNKFIAVYNHPSNYRYYIVVVIFVRNLDEIRLVTTFPTKTKQRRKIFMITETIPINYKYDITVDALMIKVDKYEHETSVPLTDDIIMDLNEKGEFIALEILNASQVLDTIPGSLENISNIDLELK